MRPPARPSPPGPQAPERPAGTGWGWRLPGACEVCRRWSAGTVCDDCLQHWRSPVQRCAQCALPLPQQAGDVPAVAALTPAGAAAGRCGACLADPPPFSRAVAACDYAHPWDPIVRDFKFGQRPELAGWMAGLMVEALQRDAGPAAAGSGLAVDAVLPVPLSAARLAERGYNQAWELARRVAARLQLKADNHSLIRAFDTAHQADLDREARAANLRGAFMVEPRQRATLRGQRLALVDDVLTTGATLRAATAELLRAGAADVQVWVFARTPAP